VAHHLDLGVWVRLQVPEPTGILRRAALRGNEGDGVAGATEDERVRPLLPARAACREEDRDRRIIPPAEAELAVISR
jgi:hypothetical protein